MVPFVYSSLIRWLNIIDNVNVQLDKTEIWSFVLKVVIIDYNR